MVMNRAVLIAWWVGLIGALIATLVILKEVSLVLRTLRDIHFLAETTRDAARGIAVNVATVHRLSDAAEPLGRLDAATESLVSSATSIEQKLAKLAPETSRPGG
jgi:hypothetical protein